MAYRKILSGLGGIDFIFKKSNLYTNEPGHAISNNEVCATSKGSDQPAHMRSLFRAFASHLNIATDLTEFGFSKLKRRLHRRV